MKIVLLVLLSFISTVYCQAIVSVNIDNSGTVSVAKDGSSFTAIGTTNNWKKQLTLEIPEEDITRSTVIKFKCTDTGYKGGFIANVKYKNKNYYTKKPITDSLFKLFRSSDGIISPLVYTANGKAPWYGAAKGGIPDSAYWVWNNKVRNVMEFHFSFATLIPLKCPVGSSQVGDLNADIGGCGLEGCGARYAYKNMEACLAGCKSKSDCVAFTWAPLSGDKNHPNKRVCTLYNSATPTSTWGDEQIFCKVDETEKKEKKELIAELKETLEKQRKKHEGLSKRQKEEMSQLKETVREQGLLHKKHLSDLTTKQRKELSRLDKLLRKQKAAQKKQVREMGNTMKKNAERRRTHMRNIVRKHGQTQRKYIRDVKKEILREMKRSFNKNNRQTDLLQQIDRLKHQQTDLQLRHQLFESEQQQRHQLKRQTNAIIQSQLQWQQRRQQSREKRRRARQKLLRKEHEMRTKEQKQLINGLRGFLMAFGRLYNNPYASSPQQSDHNQLLLHLLSSIDNPKSKRLSTSRAHRRLITENNDPNVIR